MENQCKELLRSSDQREAFGVRQLQRRFHSAQVYGCLSNSGDQSPHSKRSARWASIILTVSLSCFGGLAVGADSKHATRGMVSSVHPLATEAGLNVLKSGGNAIDAAVAVGLTLGVVDTPNSGIGGGCFMLIRLANGKFVAIDGRETAPAAAKRDMFVRNGKADTDLSQTGALASGVPGELAAFDYAVRKHGKKKLSELILPAREISEKGFTLNASYANRLKAEAKDMEKFESSRAVFFKDGQPLQRGDVLQQPDLAATYRAIAGQGIDWFYRGAVARASRPFEASQNLRGGTPVPLGFAQATEQWMNANGGLMTAADFANYQIKLREPVTTTYRGYKIVSFAPPSSGGVHLVQMLNILEKFDLKSLDEATRLHVIAEAMKLAFADRAYWLGDPDFARVPRGLVSKKYAATLAKRINLARATDVGSHGVPLKWERDVFEAGREAAASLSPQRGAGITGRDSLPDSTEIPATSWNPSRRAALKTHAVQTLRAEGGLPGVALAFGVRATSAPLSFRQEFAQPEKHTTHWSVADAEGNWVAVTATVNTSFGSKVVIPGTGVVMNNQMDDFSIQPGVPNAFGLIGAEANAVAPGKRPLSSMTPTIVLKNGKPIIALGAAGGPRIITAVLMELIYMLDLGMTAQEAIAAPRIHHQWSPGELMVEQSVPQHLRTALQQRGHEVKELNSMAVSHIVARSPDGKSFVGAADPRTGGNVAGW